MLLTSFGKKIRIALAAALAVCTAGAAQPAQAAHVRIGALECKVAPGVGLIIMSSEPMTCTFTPSGGGAPERYKGHVRKFGLDIGVTGGTIIIWAVFAAQKGYQHGALAGSYGGISAEASVGIGVGANALLGGTGRSFVLQPLSVQGQVGLDVAVAMTEIDLEPM